MQGVKDVFSRFRKRPAFTGFVLFFIIIIVNALIQGPGEFFSAMPFGKKKSDEDDDIIDSGSHGYVWFFRATVEGMGISSQSQNAIVAV